MVPVDVILYEFAHWLDAPRLLFLEKLYLKLVTYGCFCPCVRRRIVNVRTSIVIVYQCATTGGGLADGGSVHVPLSVVAACRLLTRLTAPTA